jgi:DNA-binding SARP family transcriptional activator
MSDLHIRLFGKFEVRQGAQVQTGMWTRRAQELLCYLVLHQNKPHPREALIDRLWGDYSPAQSRKQLRQVLWEMQTALHNKHTNIELLYLAETDWISFNLHCGAWIDVHEFEQACERAQHMAGQTLDDECASALQHAIELYRGDLLEGWYQDWCLYERERLQNLYLDMLDKLMAYCEVHQQYETGLEYGARILHYDRARERTHWQLMCLYYSANDRAGALRQFQRCATALDQELGVKPSQRTMVLYEQIRADHVPGLFSATLVSSPPTHSTPFPHLLERLKSLRVTLNDLQRQVDQALQAFEETVGN